MQGDSTGSDIFCAACSSVFDAQRESGGTQGTTEQREVEELEHVYRKGLMENGEFSRMYSGEWK